MVTSNRLKEVRLKKGLSQLELSRRSRIAPGNISCIENGKQFPYAGWRHRLAEALGATEEELFPGVTSDGK